LFLVWLNKKCSTIMSMHLQWKWKVISIYTFSNLNTGTHLCPWIIQTPYIYCKFHIPIHFVNANREFELIRPKIKFCLFPLSNRPTKIAATQKISLPHMMKNYFFEIIFSFKLYMNLANVSNKRCYWTLINKPKH
jgi:hypothetical protein